MGSLKANPVVCNTNLKLHLIFLISIDRMVGTRVEKSGTGGQDDVDYRYYW